MLQNTGIRQGLKSILKQLKGLVVLVLAMNTLHQLYLHSDTKDQTRDHVVKPWHYFFKVTSAKNIPEYSAVDFPP